MGSATGEPGLFSKPSSFEQRVDHFGVVPVLPTPFHASREVDLDSWQSLVAEVSSWDVDGWLLFGLASESDFLTIDERLRLLDAFEEASPRSRRFIGCGGTSWNEIRHQMNRLRGASHAGIMIKPPPGENAMATFNGELSAIAAITPILIVQHAPQWTGVDPSVGDYEALTASGSSDLFVKVESTPASDAIARFTALGLKCVAGAGGLRWDEDRAMGATGIMPGVIAARAIASLWRHSGNPRDRSDLAGVTARALAKQMVTLDRFISVEKLALAELGLIASPTIRIESNHVVPEIAVEDAVSLWLASRSMDLPAATVGEVD